MTSPFRLPAAAHPGTVHLQVSDLARSLSYYEGVLGLHQQRVTEHSATLGVRGAERSLVTLQTRPGVTPARRGAFGLYHFAILLPERRDLGKFLAHLQSLGIEPGMSDHAVSEALYLRDPDGLGIEVYVDRPRDAWTMRGQEIVMVTEPLDRRGVIAAGGGATWAGAPGGTVMGHVHLHVGNLAEAESFYHRALGFDRTLWSYPGALFMSAGGYHHHLGTNTWAPGPAAAPDESRLLAWELLVPSSADVDAVAENLRSNGRQLEKLGAGIVAEDPWRTRVHILPEG